MPVAAQIEIAGGFDAPPDTSLIRQEKSDTRVVLIARSRIHLSERFGLRSFNDAAAIAALATAIRAHGVLQPLVVRPHPEHPGHFETIVGTRRYLATAAEYAGLGELPCVVHSVDDASAEMLAIRATLTTAPVSHLDEARMVGRIKRSRIARHESATNQALAEVFCRFRGYGSTGWVSQRLTIDTHLNPQLVQESGLSASDLDALTHAALLSAAQQDSEQGRIEALRSAVQQARKAAALESVDLHRRATRPRIPRAVVSYRRTSHDDGSLSLRFCPSRMTAADKALALEHLTPILAALGLRLSENAPDAGGSHP